MKTFILVILFISSAAFAAPAAAQQTEPFITFPIPGDAIQGSVTVLGTSDIPGFDSMELAFAYASNPTDTWYLIATSDLPVTNAELGIWDTNGITDGVYSLRLRVNLADGAHRDALVTGLRVRNYTPIETATPAETPTPTPGLVEPTSMATLTPTSTPFPTPTSLPTNPAMVTTGNVKNSLVYGALTAVALFFLFGLFVRLRKHR